MQNNPINILKNALKESFSKYQISSPEAQLRFTPHAHMASADTLKYAKLINTTPLELTQKIKQELEQQNLSFLDKVEIAGPGYLNFFFNKEYFDLFLRYLEQVDSIDYLQNQKYLIEHSSPNLFKPFHIGHLVNQSYGEALVRLYKFAGAKVWSCSFPSDVSVGIAKAIWGLLYNFKDLDSVTLKQIGEAYALGHKAYQEDESAREQIHQINMQIYNQEGDKSVLEVYQKGKQISLDYFFQITKKLGSEFDAVIFESEAERVGKQIVLSHPEIFRQVESGAYLFEGSKYGLHDDIFVNQFGMGTYLAKDLGLLKIKKEKFDFSKSITITDNEQKSHFQLVKKAAELVDKNLIEGVEFLHHGRLNLEGRRLSSRSGQVLLAQELIDTLSQEALAKLNESPKQIDNKQQLAEQIGIAAVKFEVLRVSMGKNIQFSINKALSFSGDSGPYLLYALVRAKSILESASDAGIEASLDFEPFFEFELELQKFLNIVHEAIDKKQPSLLTHYLLGLAAAFNSFYGQEKILDGSPSQGRKIFMVKVFANILEHGLKLLAIEPVERM